MKKSGYSFYFLSFLKLVFPSCIWHILKYKGQDLRFYQICFQSIKERFYVLIWSVTVVQLKAGPMQYEEAKKHSYAQISVPV